MIVLTVLTLFSDYGFDYGFLSSKLENSFKYEVFCFLSLINGGVILVLLSIVKNVLFPF